MAAIIYYVNYVKDTPSGLAFTSEVYAYEFIAATRRDTLRTIGRQACNPDLSLDWHDAWELENRIRNLCKDGERCERWQP